VGMIGTPDVPEDRTPRCAKCGTANPPEVAECLYCGELLVGGRPVKPGARRGARLVVLLLKLLCAVAVGVLVFIVSRDAAYDQFRRSYLVRRPGYYTLRSMAGVREAIEAYRREHQALPDSIRDLSPPGDVAPRRDERGVFVDEWERALHYSTDGAEYELVSYGRDGKPGGVGLDADLSTDDLPEGDEGAAAYPQLPERALPTYQQFVADRGEFGAGGSGRSMLVTCIVTAVVAFLVAFWTTGSSRTSGSFILALILTTSAALLIGVFVAALHAPTGH